MKPILFNTEMARAILDGRKTATRRVLKNQDENAFCAAPCEDEDNGSVDLICENADGTKYALYNKAPYQVGDILYVRETWAKHPNVDGAYVYRAFIGTGLEPEKQDAAMLRMGLKWHPSIHMPKEAARIFLRVTGVRTEKLQDITPAGVVYEGAYEDCRECLDTYSTTGKQCCYRDEDECSQCESVIESFAEVWNNCYASPQPVKENGKIVRYESYPWEDIRETRTYRGLPWLVIGNPFVWVIEFEKIKSEDIHNE